MASRFAAAKLGSPPIQPIQPDARALLISEQGASPAAMIKYLGINRQRIYQLLQAAQLHPSRLRCAQCNRPLRNYRADDGLLHYCNSKPCQAAQMKRRYQHDPEFRVTKLQYQHATRPMQSATQMRWQKEHREKVRQYRRTMYWRRKARLKEQQQP